MLVPLRRLLVAAILLIGILPLTLTAAEEQKKAENPPDQAAATPVDRYAVPEGDVAALLKFIEELQVLPAHDGPGIRGAPKKGFGGPSPGGREDPRAGDRQAIRRVSESPRHRSSTGPLQALPTASAEEQRKIFQEIRDYLAAKKALERTDLSLAFSIRVIAGTKSRTPNWPKRRSRPLETASRKTRTPSWHAMATKCWDPSVA